MQIAMDGRHAAGGQLKGKNMEPKTPRDYEEMAERLRGYLPFLLERAVADWRARGGDEMDAATAARMEWPFHALYQDVSGIARHVANVAAFADGAVQENEALRHELAKLRDAELARQLEIDVAQSAAAARATRDMARDALRKAFGGTASRG